LGGCIEDRNSAEFIEVPVTLSGRSITLVLLSPEHEDGLREAAADGALWNIRMTSVPKTEYTRQYIEDVLTMHQAGNRLAFAMLGTAT
jgi:N-acetyltransferase